VKNVILITGCREQGDALSVPLVSLTAKCRLLNKAIGTNINNAEKIVRCICLLHNIVTDLEGTTHDPSVLQETLQIHGSRHAKRMSVVDHSFGAQRSKRYKKYFQSML